MAAASTVFPKLAGSVWLSWRSLGGLCLWAAGSPACLWEEPQAELRQQRGQHPRSHTSKPANPVMELWFFQHLGGSCCICPSFCFWDNSALLVLAGTPWEQRWESWQLGPTAEASRPKQTTSDRYLHNRTLSAADAAGASTAHPP